MRLLRHVFPPMCLMCKYLSTPHAHARLCTECVRRCLDHRVQAPVLLQDGLTFVGYHYRSPLTMLLHQFKYHACWLSGCALVDLMVLAFGTHPWQNYDGVLVMPAHPKRIKARGAHVTDMLMRQCLKRLGFEHLLYTRLNWRPVHQNTQMGLSRQARLEHMHAGVFDMPKLEGHWLLFDDVITTGQTMHACLQALSQTDLTLHVMSLFCVS